MNRMPVPLSGLTGGTDRLAALADQCVMCGLCLPHCPTYRLERVEAESPRGRIALARALADGRLDPTPAALAHLDHCLGCLSCQKVCPSDVQYEEILVQTRAAFVPRATGLATWLHDPQRLTILARLGAATGAAHWAPWIARLLPRGSRWRRLATTVPGVPPIPRAAGPTRVAKASRVALFRGCVASVYDRDTLAAARRLLEASGHAVVELAGTRCCGALPRHAGDLARASAESATTREALCETGVQVVLSCASGCHGDLRDQVAAGTGLRVLDVHAFLADDPGFAALRFRPRAARAALHLPCTQVNVVGATAPIRDLLARVPQLEVLALPEQPRCCGAAGSYFIEHPVFADRLRKEKLEQVALLAPELLLTTNIGCRIHLGNGLQSRADSVPVLHPLALLAQQLENPSP
ncbi:(Fe-S)-binding protein [Dokdonella sp.]|uniref:(Fe-S)-binding protein n=1 Tax=Dokdonella sp. TaxID=2291710 RepID=UPI0037830E72